MTYFFLLQMLVVYVSDISTYWLINSIHMQYADMFEVIFDVFTVITGGPHGEQDRLWAKQLSK